MTRRAGGLIMYRYTERGERFTHYGRTEEECLAKRYAPRPVVTVDERTTLADYLELWVAGLSLRPNTIDGHRYNVEHYLRPLFGDRLRLVDLDRELVRLKLAELRTYTTRSGRTIAPRTVALAFATLRAAMNAAVDDGRIPANPCARIRATSSDAAERRVGVELAIPTELELRRVIRTTRGEPLHALLMLTVATGLRQSEALGLSVDDLEVAVETRFLRVHRSLRRFDRTIARPKNATSERFVPIPTSLVPVLSWQLAELRRLELVAGLRWSNPDRLAFTDATGGPLVGSTVSHWFADACTRAGVARYRWHDLRHFYASNLIARNVPIAKVAKLLGHSSVVVTSTTYHHVIRDSSSLDEAELAANVLEPLASAAVAAVGLVAAVVAVGGIPTT
jgi:integrase